MRYVSPDASHIHVKVYLGTNRQFSGQHILYTTIDSHQQYETHASVMEKWQCNHDKQPVHTEQLGWSDDAWQNFKSQ